MPEETHTYLIEYVGTYTSAVEASRRAEESVRRVGEAYTTTQTQLYDFGRATTATTAGFKDVAEGAKKTGETVRKSGHWLGRYIQRYLIRYLFVWQAMIGLKAGIRDWIQAHEEMERAIFRVQGAMSATTTEAGKYMEALADVGGEIGVPAPQMVGAATQAGPQLAGKMARWGQVTGAGPQKAMQLFTQIQRDYNLTAEETERIMARLFVAWDKLGVPIQDVVKNYDEWLGQVREVSGSIDYMNKRFAEFGEQGLDATDKLSTAWDRYLSKLGNIAPITAVQTALTDMFNVAAERMEFMERPREERQQLVEQYQEETGIRPHLRQLPEPFLRWIEEQESPKTTEGGKLSIPPTDISEALGMGWRPYQIQGGPMPEAEYEELIGGAEKWDDFFQKQNIGVEVAEREFIVLTEMGATIKRAEVSLEAIELSNEEISEQMKEAVYNWPGDVASIAMGTRSATGAAGIHTGGPTVSPPDTTPAWWTAPSQSPASEIFNMMGYQYGGRVPGPEGQAQMAVVHGGETITPAGESSVGLLRLQNDIYLDGRYVSQAVSYRLGDQLYQAQRAAGTASSGLISM